MAKSKITIATLVVISIVLASSFMYLSNCGNLVYASTSTNLTGTASTENLLKFEWPQFMGDSAFSRFSNGPAPATSDILWKANVSFIQSYLAAFNGMIFATTNTSVLALDPETGSVIWSTVVPMNGTWPVAYKLDNTRMLVESTCLETETGKILWTSTDFCADTGNFNSNSYSPEEKMFFIKMNAFVQAWDFSDLSNPPKLAWTTYVPGGGRVGSGVTYGDGKVFPGSFQDLQMAIDAKTGKVLWTTRTKTPMIFDGSYYQGKFIRGGTDDNTMYCFDADSGEILWTFAAGTDGYFTSGTAVAYGMVYEPNKDGATYAINVTDGKLVWKYQGPGTMLFPGLPTVADGKVYVTSGQNAQYGSNVGASEFACLDAFTGQPIWKLPIEAYAPRESVAIAYGNLYLIPGDVTKAVDSTSGSEYSLKSQIWAIGASSSQLSGSSWPMFRHDAARTSIGQNGPSNLTLAWKFATEGAVYSSPSVVDGIVYFGSQDKNIYAVNAWSGTLIWKYATTDAVEATPAIVNGKLATGGEDGYVYCLSAYNGSLIWKTFVNGSQPITFGAAVMLRSSPAIANNTVYIGSLDSYLYALNFTDGSIIWKYQTLGPIESSPTVANGAVYISSEEPANGGLYKLNATTGELIWKKEIPYEYQFTGGNDIQGSVTVANGMVYASANLRTYYGLNDANGEQIWKYTNPDATEFIVSTPIYLNGQLFVIDKFDLACLNASTGKKIWSSYTGDELYVAPSYADNKIYMVTSQRNIFILNAINGEKIGKYVTPSASWSSPTPYGGRLYVGNNDWNLYCLAEYTAQNTNINLQVDNSKIKLGTSLKVYGVLSPALPNSTITLTFTKPDGTKDNIKTAVAPDGAFSVNYTPNISGNWQVAADFVSNNQYFTSVTSENVQFQVTSGIEITLPTDYTSILIISVLLIVAIVATILLLIRNRTQKPKQANT
jgi:outer membrane protein assembly factor BamB